MDVPIIVEREESILPIHDDRPIIKRKKSTWDSLYEESDFNNHGDLEADDVLKVFF